ncbi:MAG: TonB-dependent receptor [Bacteroidota bacterium]
MRKWLVLLFFLGFTEAMVAQDLTQTIRGRVVDNDSQLPLIGATVQLTTLASGTTTDVDGYFRLEKMPVGRHEIMVAYLGYQVQVQSNILVSSGKEVVLNINLQESVEELATVVVQAAKDKSGSINEMASISARQFTVEEAGRYAGSRNEPSRMAQNYAGVSGSSDSRNDIIIRGNSPLGLLWRLENLDIPNPNHFALAGSNGGAISMLNLNVLSNSDFMTSAFPAEYGNATSGVFDLRMRKGNNEQREYLLAGGALGLETMIEGPFSKKSKASFLVNYRYSTTDVLTKWFNVNIGFSGKPVYQDGAFKLHFPTKKGAIELFGLGGISTYQVLAKDRDPTNFDIQFTDNANYDFKSNLGVFGLTFKRQVGQKGYWNTTIGLSGSKEDSTVDSVSTENAALVLPFQRNRNRFSKIQIHSFLKQKIAKGVTAKTGILLSQRSFSIDEKIRVPVTFELADLRQGKGQATLLQGYSSWQWRSTPKMTITAGLHFQYFGLNQTNSLEFRGGFNYQLTPKSTLNFGFGTHGQLQRLPVYFVATPSINETLFTNFDLDFTRSNHFVLGYDWQWNDYWRLKTELYYQHLTQVPVKPLIENSPFSLFNEGGDFLISEEDNLVNNGLGRNYGLELTLERFFHQEYYLLFTTSLFRSRYRAGIEQWYNSKFDARFIVNFLAGKEWTVSRNNAIVLDFKTTYAGGRRFTPIDLLASRRAGFPIFFEEQTFTQTHKNYFRTDIKLTYRINRPKMSHELFVNVDNVFNVSNVFAEYYSPLAQEVVTIKQLGWFPTFQYQIEF